MPRLDATTDLGRPACQCWSTSTMSITSNCLLAIRPPRSAVRRRLQVQGARRWIPDPVAGLGNYGGGEVGNNSGDVRSS